MKRLALAVALLAGSATPAARGDVDPVRLTVRAPERVAVGAPLKVSVRVDTDPGALDTRDGNIRMQVRLATGECGGSYLGTTGRTVIDAVLRPQPSPGASYTASAAGTTRPPKTGTLTVCAFLDDSEDRQFATDVDTQVRVVPARRHRTHRPPRGPSRHPARPAPRFTG